MQNGQVGPASGTSASTPALAGMILLLNEARLQAGKKPIAFLTIFCTKPLSFHGYHTRRRIVRIQLYQRVGPCNCNGFTAIPQDARGSNEVTQSVRQTARHIIQ